MPADGARYCVLECVHQWKGGGSRWGYLCAAWLPRTRGTLRGDFFREQHRIHQWEAGCPGGG